MIRSPPSSTGRTYAMEASCGSLPKPFSALEARKEEDDRLSITLDFKCLDDINAPISDLVIADFVFLELRLQKSEITGFLGSGSGIQRSVKVETAYPIIIEERFKNGFEFERIVNQRKWSCSVRIGKKASVIRFFNVPRWITDEELLQGISLSRK